MSAPRDGLDLLETARQQLFTAVVGDVMDKMGLLHQCLPARIRPIRADAIVLGRAKTVPEADVFAEEAGMNVSGPHGSSVRPHARDPRRPQARGGLPVR